jgi:hypothetical protein
MTIEDAVTSLLQSASEANVVDNMRGAMFASGYAGDLLDAWENTIADVVTAAMDYAGTYLRNIATDPRLVTSDDIVVATYAAMDATGPPRCSATQIALILRNLARAWDLWPRHVAAALATSSFGSDVIAAYAELLDSTATAGARVARGGAFFTQGVQSGRMTSPLSFQNPSPPAVTGYFSYRRDSSYVRRDTQCELAPAAWGDVLTVLQGRQDGARDCLLAYVNGELAPAHFQWYVANYGVGDLEVIAVWHKHRARQHKRLADMMPQDATAAPRQLRNIQLRSCNQEQNTVEGQK